MYKVFAKTLLIYALGGLTTDAMSSNIFYMIVALFSLISIIARLKEQLRTSL